MKKPYLSAVSLALILCPLYAAVAAEPAEKVIRVGIIGLDTSHAGAFTGAINDPKAEGALAEVEVVAGFPGGVKDNPASYERVDKFTAQLRERGIAIYDSIEAMLPHVDAVLLESVDGRPHLEQARPVIAAGKPLFIDKPMAASLADVLEIFRLAEEAGVPCFSSSSLRFGSGVQAVRSESPVGEVLGCDVFSPCSLEEHHPDLFWYGVHGVEMLFTVMGTGCKSVTCVETEGTHVVVGVWEDGRIGTFRGLRDGKTGYGATVFGAKAIAPAGSHEGYGPLLEQICRFFKTGVAPVPKPETIEIFAFMEAADESTRRGGCPVTIEEVLEKARQKNAARN